jgi:DNA-binding MarR family transcriptional regulator
VSRTTPPNEAGPTPLSKQEYELLAELHTALRRFARTTELAVRRIGIMPQHYLLLLALKGFPGREWATITELTERLQLRHNAVVQLVNRMETVGLVRRTQAADPTDLRIVHVDLTGYGERVLQATASSLRVERARITQTLAVVLADEASSEAAALSPIPETEADA